MSTIFNGVTSRAGQPASALNGRDRHGRLTHLHGEAAVPVNDAALRRFPARHTIRGSGKPDGQMFQIVSGHVQVSLMMNNSHQQIVAILGAGDVFAPTAAAYRDCRAQSLTQVEARFVRLQGMAEDGSIRQLSSRLQEQLDASYRHCLMITHFSALQRLAFFLVQWVRRYAPAKLSVSARGHQPFEIAMPLKRSEIANYLSMTSETMSRCFTELRRRRMISTRTPRTRGSLRIDDFCKLEMLCPRIVEGVPDSG